MDEDRLRKLRQYYHSLVGQKRLLEDLSGRWAEKTTLLPLSKEFEQLNEEFPELMPMKFAVANYQRHGSGGHLEYDIFGIASYLVIAIGRIEGYIEQSSDSPVTERRQFTFIENQKLRQIIERDYLDIQRAYISECWKSTIILCGGAIEAILTDLLLLNETAAKAAKCAPNNNDITRWDLSNLIHVAVELDMVSAGVEKLSSPIREYRNLVHPGNELRTKLEFGAEEARIAIEVLNMVHRDLT